MAHLGLSEREAVQSQIKERACLETLLPVSALFCTKITSCLVPLLLNLLKAQLAALLPSTVLASNPNCNHIYKSADFIRTMDLNFAQVFN